MVEAILQVLDSKPQARILACAPSNSAVDLMTTKLGSTLDKEAMFRLMGPSRYKSQVPEDVRKYTYMIDDTHFSVPTTDRIQRFKVIV
jgi:helicase MOV-10